MTKHTQMMAVVAVVSSLFAGCGGGEGAEPEAGAPREEQVSTTQDSGDTTVRAQACFTVTEGSPTSCKTYDAWKSYTVYYCQSVGAVAAATKVSDQCSDSPTAYRYVQMTCCN
jgi:hypothetical protein